MTNLPVYDVAIVGAGASGLICALECARAKKSVLLLEKDALPGRKILVSGNGRCNVTNRFVAPDYYHAPKDLIQNVLNGFSFKHARQYFESLGILLREEENGRIFPATGKSSSVLEPLKLAVQEAGAVLLTGHEVTRIQKKNQFILHTAPGQVFYSRRLVLACGSCAYPQVTGTESGYQLAKSLGHHIISPTAALCALNLKEKAVSRLQGIRVQVELTARLAQKTIAASRGEVLFTNYGISGPAVINVSAAAAQALRQGPVQLDLNLFADEPDFAALMQKRRECFGQRRAKDFFAGLLHENIANLLIDFAGIRKNIPVQDWTPGTWQNVVHTLQKWTFNVVSARPWTEAMAARGGVNTAEINYNTCESLKCPGLFITGELLDVDGRSGGFNLHFAWSSGFAAARKLSED